MSLVRPLSIKISNFKNVGHGCVEFPSYGSVTARAEVNEGDITGIYGQNGSGKTSVVDSFELLQGIFMGIPINYRIFSGMLMPDCSQIEADFLVQIEDSKYFVTYGIAISPDEASQKIRLDKETITFKERGFRWKKEHTATISNGAYQVVDDPFSESDAMLSIEKDPVLARVEILDATQTNINRLANYCAARGLSMLFCDRAVQRYSLDSDGYTGTFYKILDSLRSFATGDLIVVGVRQLGEVNSGRLIPVNIHLVDRNEVVMGCMPLFQMGEGEMPLRVFGALEKSVDAINRVLHAIVPGLAIRVEKTNSHLDKDGVEIAEVRTYSERDGKKFLTRYESEGIKRIISLIHALVFVYNYKGACLVVDDLDAGIFEYLLGDLVEVLFQTAKGQIIFTSHNLRVLEMIPCKNAVFTTTNRNNRYIHMKVKGRNNNVRDSYPRALFLGGQEEELYTEMELDPLAYSLRDAWGALNGGD